MAESKLFVKKCMLVPDEGGKSSLKEPQNITAGIANIDYYESLLSPTIELKVTFVDVDQLLGRLGVTGGEYIDLTILYGDGDQTEFKIRAQDHKLILNSVRDMVTDFNKQVATLEFVSVEQFVNQTARVNQKYTGNVTETVKKLLKDPTAIGTKKNLESDESANSYSFVGNLNHPFETIQWLCPKTQASKDSFGFLFYETFDGYNFKSIKSLLEQDPIEYKQSNKALDTLAMILDSNLDETNDIGMNLKTGMYANKTIYVDIESQTLKEVDFKIDDLNIENRPKLGNKLDEIPTRLMLKISDVGVSQKGSERKDRQPVSELDEYKNKSYIRNNLLFSQSLSISIPLNTNLRAGLVIDVKLPLKQGTDGDEKVDSYGSDRTNDSSGKYLISELRHIMAGGKSETQLKLIRDVTTV